ncbi:MAG: transposase [Candidatus Dojkabacteria bacterium]|jgi:putative transposase
MSDSKRIKDYRKFGIYHVYNRGHRKCRICLDVKDYNNFIRCLRRAEKTLDVSILSYCIMPNHYHLILKLGASKSDISRMMHKSMTAYSMYYNRRHGLCGSLFQGTFKCREILYSNDFDNLLEYIKNNPVKDRLCNKNKKYRWLYIKEVLPKLNLAKDGGFDSQFLDLW